MKSKVAKLIYWAITLVFVIGVYVQKNSSPTAVSDALYWLGFASLIFALWLWYERRHARRRAKGKGGW